MIYIKLGSITHTQHTRTVGCGHFSHKFSHLTNSVSFFQPGGVFHFIPGRYSNFSPALTVLVYCENFSSFRRQTLHHPSHLWVRLYCCHLLLLLFFTFSLKHFILPFIPCSIFCHCLISSFISGKCTLSPIFHISH